MKDLTDILNEWDENDSGIRRVYGNDGIEKMQMKMSSPEGHMKGIMQMNLEGRPDGIKPYGFDSLLQYYKHKFCTYCQTHGSEKGYKISPKEVDKLLAELNLYYHRCCFLNSMEPTTTEDIKRMMRDGEFNFQILDFIEKYSEDENRKKYVMDLKPAFVMFAARNKIDHGIKSKDYELALKGISQGRKRILRLKGLLGEERQDYIQNGLKVLKNSENHIREFKPITRIEQLEGMLKKTKESGNLEGVKSIERDLEMLKKDGSGK
jgi:translation initiation factor 2 beta subunit (eIF-2beta)/eIF-5